MLGQLERGDETSHTLEKIRAMDQLMSEPLVLTEEQLQKAVGGDKEKRKQIAVFLMHHEMLRQEGAWVPYQLNSGQLRLVLLLVIIRRYPTNLLISNWNCNVRHQFSSKLQGDWKQEAREKLKHQVHRFFGGKGKNKYA